jgi:hypothetical protein
MRPQYQRPRLLREIPYRSRPTWSCGISQSDDKPGSLCKDRGATGLPILTFEGRMPFHIPIFDTQDPELSLRNTPSFGKAHN